jgi:hypothetical protein
MCDNNFYARNNIDKYARKALALYTTLNFWFQILYRYYRHSMSSALKNDDDFELIERDDFDDSSFFSFIHCHRSSVDLTHFRDCIGC